METNETRKGKNSKIILKQKKIIKKKKPNKEQKIRKNKAYNNEEKPYLKRMRCVFFLQTSNLHPNKQKYKSEKETLYFCYTK